MTARKPQETQSSRSFSKRLTVASLAGIFGLAFADKGSDVITVVSSAAIAHLGLYMGTGHLDLRSWIASGLLDLRKKGPPNA